MKVLVKRLLLATVVAGGAFFGAKANGHKLRFRAKCQAPAFPALRMSKGA